MAHVAAMIWNVDALQVMRKKNLDYGIITANGGIVIGRKGRKAT